MRRAMSFALPLPLLLILPVFAACAHRAPTYSPAELQVDRIAVLNDDSNVTFEYAVPPAAPSGMTRSALVRTVGHYYVETDDRAPPRRRPGLPGSGVRTVRLRAR